MEEETTQEEEEVSEAEDGEVVDDEDVTDEDDHEDDDDENDDDDKDSDKADEDTYNLWSYLSKAAAGNQVIVSKYKEAAERLAEDGELTATEVNKQANLVIRPDILSHVFTNYTNFLNIWHFAGKDPYHRQIMKTKRKAMDEDDMGPVEAIQYAVKKRKYLIIKATGMLDDDIPLDEKVPTPDMDEDGSEDEDGSKDGDEE